MTTNKHTPIANGASNDASTWNNPLGQLDAAITANENEIVAARGGSATLGARIAAVISAYQSADNTLDGRIDNLIINAGDASPELADARTAIPSSSAAPTLAEMLRWANANVYNVKAFGAMGDGITDDAAAINAVFAATQPGDTILFPAGHTFKINSTVTLAKANVTILGYGATIDATGLDNNTGSQNAAIRIDDGMSGVTIAGLRLIGPPTAGTPQTPAETANTVGIYIRNCDHCKVRDCHITGFFRGGIWVQGSYHTVQGNHLVGVRHRSPYYGSIFATGTSIVVTGNIITQVFDCGIGITGTYCTVSDNYIEGADWTVETGATSIMGIQGVNGVNNCTITGNTIRRTYFEGIILSTGSLGVTSNGNTIAGNTLIDCWRGINLRAIGGSEGTPHYCRYNTIVGNTIYSAATPGARATGAGIMLESNSGTSYNFCTHNLVSGNVVSGANSLLERGIYTTGGRTRIAHNAINNNVVNSATVASIACSGQYCSIANNQIRDCANGISLSFVSYSQISGNSIEGSSTNSIVIGAYAPTRLIITDNIIDRKVNYTSASGSSYVIARNTISGQVMFGTVQLNGVTGVNISGAQFASVNSDAEVELFRLTPASVGANTGVPYVYSVDQANNRITVKSTVDGDDGTVRWRIVR